MNIDGLKNVKISAQRTQMTFCASCKSCPAIDISTESDTVVVGGEDEGYTEFTKEQFALFVKTVKEGAYDRFIEKECICGTTSNEDGTCDGSHAGVCDDSKADLNEDVPFGD
jgi:CDGSH-type Zn-finger protein|tara:strand:+ start:1506 stop:1841 length:336 start_codon:yes stop_codon:yes gene_type:complete